MRLRLGAALALVLALCASPVLANDISNWSTTDANNNATPPNGWPSGTMLPSQVEPTGRSMMGAIARWYAALGGYNSAAASNTVALRALSTTNYGNGITRLTDGVASAPPLRYVPDTGATCSADDGASCIAAAAGGVAYWKAAFPGNVADAREWGAIADNTTDDSVALQSAINWAAATGGTLYLSSSNSPFYSTATLTANVATNGEFNMTGSGYIRFGPSVANGLVVNVGGQYSTVHLRDFTLLAGSPDATGSGIFLHQTAISLPAPAATPPSDVSNVTLRGSDGIGANNYWNNGLKIDYVSNVDIEKFNYNADHALHGTGINIAGGSNVNTIGVIYNIKGANMYPLNTGINYGPYIQGVTVQYSNFTGCKFGIVNSNSTQTGQLNVSDNQFECIDSAIDNAGGVSWVNIHNNLLIPGDDAGVPNRAFISDSSGNDIIIQNNIIDGSGAGSEGGLTAISVYGGGPGSTGVIEGNDIINLNFGIAFSGAEQGMRVANNNMTNVTNPYSTPAGPTTAPNSISSTKAAFAPISNVGATGLSPNFVQLTVSSTSGFYTGEWVCVSGTSGGSDPQANICTTISITDGTHIVLLEVVSDGNSYASGGYVAAIP